MGISNYLGNKILDIIAGKSSSLSCTGVVYLALSTSAPNADGTGVTEPSGNGYARTILGSTAQSMTQVMDSASGKNVKNNKKIFLGKATGAWGTCTHFAIYDASTGGNLLAYGELTNSITTSVNVVPVVDIEDLSISLT